MTATPILSWQPHPFHHGNNNRFTMTTTTISPWQQQQFHHDNKNHFTMTTATIYHDNHTLIRYVEYRQTSSSGHVQEMQFGVVSNRCSELPENMVTDIELPVEIGSSIPARCSNGKMWCQTRGWCQTRDWCQTIAYSVIRQSPPPLKI